MKPNKAARLFVVTILLVGCGKKEETYSLHSPGAPVAGATLQISGKAANLIVKYTDGTSVNLSGKVQRNGFFSPGFTLSLTSPPESKFQFNAAPIPEAGALSCADCLKMSAVKELKADTSLVNWVPVPEE